LQVVVGDEPGILLDDVADRLTPVGYGGPKNLNQ
jgi:hypothetical protein